MPIYDVTIQGKMYVADPIPPGLPPGGGPPGLHPMPPVYYPPGIWGPPGPWPGPPIYFPPGGGGGPPGGGGGPPVGIWPGPGPLPHPEHPIVLPPPGGGGGPPSIWPGPYPSHPIMLPGMPGWGPGGPQPPQPPVYYPVPPDLKPPGSDPTYTPDLASPGYWSIVMLDGDACRAWIQAAILTGPDHEPKPPTKGLPGEWMPVYNPGVLGVLFAWLPTPEARKAATP